MKKPYCRPCKPTSVISFSRCLILLLLLHTAGLLQAQQNLQDTRMVGMLSFATNNYHDSVAAKNIYAAVSRILVQTKRFTVLEMDKWKLTQEEMERQKDAAFIDRTIIAKGKSLGAQVLIVGFVKNAEIYQDAGKYAARVDYELKYIDVETGKSIAAATFKGDSEGMANMGAKASKGLARLITPMWWTRGNWKAVTLSSAAMGALSEADKSAINGKTIDAIEESAERVNAWVRNTFGFSLLFMKVLEDDKKKGAEFVLVEGGEDIGIKQGYKLKMVLVTEMETSRGKIRDEEPVAELEVTEVRAQTSKCRVIKGGNRVLENSQKQNMRIVFD